MKSLTIDYKRGYNKLMGIIIIIIIITIIMIIKCIKISRH